MMRASLHLAVLCLALTLSGCGVAYPALLALLGADDGSSSSSSVGTTVSIDPVTRQTGPVVIRFTLTDERSETVDVAIEYAVPGGDFTAATELADDQRSNGKTSLTVASAAVGGAPHTFVWDAEADRGGEFAVGDVRVRITPTGGSPQVSPPFTVGNDPPRFVADAIDANQEGLVVVEGTLFDSTGDDVSLTLEVTSGATFPATVDFGDVGLIRALPEREGGVRVSLGWNSLVDVPTTALATLRLTVADELDESEPVELDFAIDNDEQPSVYIEPIERTTTPGPVDIGFRLFDLLSDTVDLELALTAENGEQALTRDGQTIALQAGRLTALPSSPLGEPGVLVWDAATDLAAFGPGAEPVTRVTLSLTPRDTSGLGSTRTVTFLIGAAAPAIVLDAFAEVEEGVVPVAFTLTGPGDPSDAILTFHTDADATERPLTLSIGEVAGLETTPGGTRHRAGWASLADLGLGTHRVTVRAVPVNRAVTPALVGTAVEARLVVSNTDRMQAVITSPVAGELISALDGAPVPVAFTLLDLQGDDGAALVEVDTGDGRGWHTAPDGMLSGLASDPGGASHIFLYRPQDDGVVAATGDRPEVHVRVTPTDPLSGVGEPGEAGPFAVDVNQAPAVAPISIDGRPPVGNIVVAGVVDIELGIEDAEGDAVEVRLEASTDNGSTFAPVAPFTIARGAGATATTLSLSFDSQPFGVNGLETVILRLTPVDQLMLDDDARETLGVGASTLVLFGVDNSPNPAPWVIASLLAGGVQRGTVRANLTYNHELGDPVGFEVEVAVSGQASGFSPATTVYSNCGLFGCTPPFQLLGGGLLSGSVELRWPSNTNVGAGFFDPVQLRITPVTAPLATAGRAPSRGAPVVLTFALDHAVSANLVLGKPSLDTAPIDNRGVDGPSGVAAGDGYLWVVDTGNHRVLQFDSRPSFDFQGADVVLGQPGINDTRGTFHEPSLERMREPLAAAFDAQAGTLFVSDRGGDLGAGRVLIWTAVPTMHGEPAALEVVVPSPQGGNAVELTGLALAGDDLYVADRANARVMRFQVSALLQAGAGGGGIEPAPELSLTTGVSPSGFADMGGPIDVAVRVEGPEYLLVVADPSAARLLLWERRPTTGDVLADRVYDSSDPLIAPGAIFTSVDFLEVDSVNPVLVFGNAAIRRAQFMDFGFDPPEVSDFFLQEASAPNAPPGATSFGDAGPVDIASDELIYAVDATHNRVLVFDPEDPGTSFANGISAKSTVGQPGPGGAGAPNHAVPSAETLHRPGGVAQEFDSLLSSYRLFVADTGNARVVIWDAPPTADGEAASVVLGQQDFTTRLTPDPGLPNAAQLVAPVSLAAGNDTLFVSDPGLERMLVWSPMPTTDGEPADLVRTGISASALAYDPFFFVLAAAEPSRNRVLVWTNVLTPADVAGPPTYVLGQPDASQTLANNPALADAAKLRAPRSVAIDAFIDAIVVGDDGNGRVLFFPLSTARTGAAATSVLGQAGLQLSSYDPTLPPPLPSIDTFSGPLGGLATSFLTNKVYMLDAGAHRLVWWDDAVVAPPPAGAPADGIMGQLGFDRAETNSGGVSARSLHLAGPTAAAARLPLAPVPSLAIDLLDQVWITDTHNDRVIRLPMLP